MKINEVEALVGITKKNIRFYEEKGLLSPGRNSENGYRDYGQAEVDALRRIKLLRKLGVPIEEIRRMQQGTQTVGDGMRRHLVTLERERQNLEESVKLCELLKERTEPLNELDALSVLEEMEKLEQSGTTFQNKQRQDVRIRYVAPVVVAAAVVVLLGAFMGVMIWGVLSEPAQSPPVWIVVVMTAVPGLGICGVLYALFQRITEIRKGEIDDARQY
ncbi:MAG: MerR family transcriptional regulator [Oscillospiraceae bacterium]|nr:MerR family transcriptional regulator [Oscillospiraceae bacterium]